MDEDGSGGVSKKEFLEFSNENFIFLALGHVYQEMLRKKQFGEAYWVELTKRLANRGRDATVLGSNGVAGRPRGGVGGSDLLRPRPGAPRPGASKLTVVQPRRGPVVY